ncbi:hypothetical protein [Desulfonatronovibrio hydrogenovorans]|uniref:hypothetical protein n=1 Tax=Desulfonatronovibrio hydrogenovorans TaxID=53245 RepID=UPI00048C44BF|nr:hypothetical protein [Desulfonatronovibrio hydrogenovorans]
MLAKVKTFFQALFSKRRLHSQIKAREFQDLARELMYLAEIAARIAPEQDSTTEKLRKIKQEMETLSQLVDSRDFLKIPPETRQELKESILASRRQVVESIHHAPPPTDILQ